LLDLPGWWERDIRVAYPMQVRPPEPGARGSFGIARKGPPADGKVAARRTPPLVITGGSGTLGRAFARICELRAIPYVALTRSDLDITEENQVVTAIEHFKPWAIVNAAGYVRVDDAEADRERCFRENVNGAVNIASVCAERGIRSAAFSSDLVFDGRSRAPYREGSPVAPLNVYGRSKAEAEQAILKAAPEALVIRTSTFFGPWDQANFLTRSLNCLRNKDTLVVPEEGTFSPTYVPDLVHVSLDLLLDGASNIWHLTNVGQTNWVEFARSTAKVAAVDVRNIRTVSMEELSRPAPRPSYSVLGSERGVYLPLLDDAVARYCHAVANA
jgi:dTDP-4-dehydrorhamnose reductase